MDDLGGSGLSVLHLQGPMSFPPSPWAKAWITIQSAECRLLKLETKYWFAGHPPCIQHPWLLLESVWRPLCLSPVLFSVWEILCLLGKYLPANCFWLQIHAPSWWRALTNHSRSTRPGGATQYLPLSTKWGKKSESVSHSFVSDSAILWTVSHQVPLSMWFPRQEYKGGLPFPSLEDLPDPGIKLDSPELQADSLPSEPPGTS